MSRFGLIPEAFGRLTWKFLETFLFGVKHDDPWSLALSALVLLTVAAAAGFAPALRASRIDPMAALRHE